MVLISQLYLYLATVLTVLRAYKWVLSTAIIGNTYHEPPSRFTPALRSDRLKPAQDGSKTGASNLGFRVSGFRGLGV